MKLQVSDKTGAIHFDTITDYNVLADRIEVDNAVFVGLAAGALTAFAANITGTATGAFAQIIYETDTGALWFDSNGTGANGQTHFATLDTKPATLGASEFTVI
jgi:serralysin